MTQLTYSKSFTYEQPPWEEIFIKLQANLRKRGLLKRKSQLANLVEQLDECVIGYRFRESQKAINAYHNAKINKMFNGEIK